MEAIIKRGRNQQLKEILKIKINGSWAEENEKLKNELKIEESDIKDSEYHLKNTLSKRVKEYFVQKLKESSESKSKMQYYMNGKVMTEPIKRSEYINKLTRNQVSTIIRARTRMLKVKLNYKNGHEDLKCRLCGTVEESQNHILEECEKLKQVTPDITKEMIFSEDINELRETAKIINERMEIVENS